MIPYLLRYWRWAALLAGATALWLHGHHVGRTACEARHLRAENAVMRDAFRAAEIASRKEAARLEAEAAREDLARQLEEAAREEPVRHPDCLPVERVRRINQR